MATLALLAAAMFAFVAASKEMTMGKSKVNVDDFGVMTFRHHMGNPLKIKLDELMQVDIDGKALADCKEPNNSSLPGMGWMKETVQKREAMKGYMKNFRNFAQQKFTLGSKRVNQNMQHGGAMKAQMLKFIATLSDGIGKITIDMAMPEEDGTVNIAGEKQKLTTGDMKFNMELSEWNWCDNAAFLDVNMKVSGKQKPKKRSDRSKIQPASYYMGDNMTVSFSGKYRNDSGAWVDMPDDFPKVDTVDTSRIIVRFPRFEENLVYDPTVYAVDDGDDNDTSAGSHLSVSAILIVMTTTTVYAMLV